MSVLSKIVSFIVLFFRWLPQLIDFFKTLTGGKKELPSFPVEQFTDEPAHQGLAFTFQSSSGWSVEIREKKSEFYPEEPEDYISGLLSTPPQDPVSTGELAGASLITETVKNFAFNPPKIELFSSNNISFLTRMNPGSGIGGQIMGQSFIFNHDFGRSSSRISSHFLP